MDSFDHYVTADLTEKWTSIESGYFGVISINSTGGRRSSGSFRWVDSGANGNAFGSLKKTLAPADTVGIVGFSISMPSGVPNVTNGTPIVAFRDTATVQVCLKVNSDRTISAVRGLTTTGTVLGTSSATLPTTAAYIEFKTTIHASAGTIDVRMNGASILSLTSQNTRNTANTSWNGINLGIYGDIFAVTSGTASLNVDFDDVYVLDGSGAAPWNAFLGDVRVDARYPTGAGATTGWTPLASTNWSNVDDTAPDDDTTYNSAASVLTDTFVVQDAPVVGATIYGVQHCISMKKMDAGTASVAPVIRHSSVDNVGSNINPGTSYNYGLAVNQTNPGTSAAWTEAGFNAAEFGYKKTV